MRFPPALQFGTGVTPAQKWAATITPGFSLITLYDFEAQINRQGLFPTKPVEKPSASFSHCSDASHVASFSASASSEQDL
jgi:hypothetical protein